MPIAEPCHVFHFNIEDGTRAFCVAEMIIDIYHFIVAVCEVNSLFIEPYLDEFENVPGGEGKRSDNNVTTFTNNANTTNMTTITPDTTIMTTITPDTTTDTPCDTPGKICISEGRRIAIVMFGIIFMLTLLSQAVFGYLLYFLGWRNRNVTICWVWVGLAISNFIIVWILYFLTHKQLTAGHRYGIFGSACIFVYLFYELYGVWIVISFIQFVTENGEAKHCCGNCKRGEPDHGESHHIHAVTSGASRSAHVKGERSASTAKPPTVKVNASKVAPKASVTSTAASKIGPKGSQKVLNK